MGMISFAEKLSDKDGLLYPALAIGAVAMTVSSVFGVAVMTGALPLAVSTKDSCAESAINAAGYPEDACGNCGVVESIAAVAMKSDRGRIGFFAGGVSGALIGNQIGRGADKTVATIAGTVDGIETLLLPAIRYRVYVRMPDGALRVSDQTFAPVFAIGDSVRIVNGQIVMIW
jgi:outer membrane lipoprotein SlyB